MTFDWRAEYDFHTDCETVFKIFERSLIICNKTGQCYIDWIFTPGGYIIQIDSFIKWFFYSDWNMWNTHHHDNLSLWRNHYTPNWLIYLQDLSPYLWLPTDQVDIPVSWFAYKFLSQSESAANKSIALWSF